MAESLRLDPKKCAFIIIDMVNAITKGQGPPYQTPPQREALVQNYVRLVTHCRSVGTPLIYTVIHRHPDNIDAPKTLADAGRHPSRRDHRRHTSPAARLGHHEAALQRLLRYQPG